MIPGRRPRDWTNWAGTVRCAPAHRAAPVTVEQIQSEVLRAAEDGERLRVVGSGHSFSALCWTDDNHLSLERFTGIESVDVERRRVQVRAGTSLGQLTEALAARGLALENAPDHDRQTLAGALATGSHGTGASFGTLASLVTALQLVGSDGSVRTLGAETDADAFHAAQVSLGALGVVTHVELQCVPHYALALSTRAATLGETLASLEALRRDHRNSAFYWFPHTASVIQRRFDVRPAHGRGLSPLRRGLRRSVDAAILRGLSLAARRSPRLVDSFGAAATRLLSGRHDVLGADAAYPLRRRSRFQQLEYVLPVAQLEPALRRLDQVVRALSLHVHFPVEVRFVAADRAWLSPAHGRDSACVAVAAYPDTPFDDYFAPIAEVLERHDGRPHWGMVHALTVDTLRGLYPRFDDFCALRRRWDPRGLFLNPHLAALFGESLR